MLNLQATLEMVKLAIQNTHLDLAKGSSLDGDTSTNLDTLKRAHSRLQNKVEALYTSLNVTDLSLAKGIGLNALCLLILAQDLKINICKCTVGVFLELEWLNQVLGGQENTLRTRMHQQARGSISK